MGVSDSSQLKLDFESSSEDFIRKFYSETLDKFKDSQENHNTPKSLSQILSEELPKDEKGLKPFTEAYIMHEPFTSSIIEKLITEMLDLWRFDALEYSKIFYYPYPSKEEKNLLESIGRIIMGKNIVARTADVGLPKVLKFALDTTLAREKDVHSSRVVDIRLPDILGELLKEGYLDDKDIAPKLPGKIPLCEEFVISWHYYRILDMHRAFNITPRIIERIDEKFRIGDGPYKREYGLMKPRNVNSLYSMTLDEIVRTVKEHSSNVFSADVPVSGYSMMMKLKPKEFLDKHVIKLALMLQLGFGKYESKDFMDTRGENFITIKAFKSLDVNISLHERYSILSFNRSFIFTDYKSDDGFMIYGIKLMLENYCRNKGIHYYGEVDIEDAEKTFFLGKYKSAIYAKENMDRIRIELTGDVMVRIIDYCNHTFAFNAYVEDISHCEYCGNGMISGMFRYDPSGYIIKDDDPKLEQPEVEFPLNNLHILREHPERYNPKIYELEAIDQLIRQSKDWTVRSISPDLEQDYTAVMRMSADVMRAGIEISEWCDEVHGSISKEQLEAHPELQELVDMEKKIFNEPERLNTLIEPSIDKIIDYMNKTYGGMSKKYKDWIKSLESRPFDDPKGILNLKQSFIESTYNTFKTMHSLNPSPFTLRVIEAVESRYKELFPKHKHALKSEEKRSYIQGKPPELGNEFLY